jgi:hypothetical protein
MKQKVTGRLIYITSILFVLTWAAASALWVLLDVGLPVRILIGLVPAGFLVFQIVLAFRYATGQDEVQRRIILEGLAIAFAVALPVIFLVGVIMKAGLNLPLEFIDGVYFLDIAFLAGYAIAYRRYQ